MNTTQEKSPIILRIFTFEDPNTEYLFEVRGQVAFFKYIKGTIAYDYVELIIKLFNEANTNCVKGFLLIPADEIKGTPVEVQEIFSDGGYAHTNTSCSEIRSKFSLSI